MRAFIIGLLASGLLGGSAAAQETVARPLEQAGLKYAPFPLFPGISVAPVSGTASKPGSLYVLSVRYARGARALPHTHPDARVVTVLAGTFYAGTGSKFDEAAMRALQAGSFIVIPANAVHYGWAKDGDVLLEEVGVGPTGVKLWPNAASAGK